MRRALLTARAAAPAFTVGNPAIDGSTFWGTGFLVVATENPAPRDGTITTIKYWAETAGLVRFVTGTLSGSTFTPTSITSGTLTAALGYNEFAVSYSILTGGVIGLWSPASGGATHSAATISGSTARYATTSNPAVATSTFSEPTNRLSLQAIGA